MNPSKGNATAKMDIILMRNVLMYFNAETKKAIFAKVKLVFSGTTSGGKKRTEATQNSGH